MKHQKAEKYSDHLQKNIDLNHASVVEESYMSTSRDLVKLNVTSKAY